MNTISILSIVLLRRSINMFSFDFLFLFAMLYLCDPQGSLASEPVCSKFSYEEQLLEKMIRTDIKVETMQKEIKKTEESLLNTLNDIEKTAAKDKNKSQELGNKLTEQIEKKMKELHKEAEQFKQEFEEVKLNITKEIKDEMDNLAEAKKTMFLPTVAFYAHDVKDLNLDVEEEVLVFRNVITNEGSGYDSSTGIFTASIAGVYQFSVHTCAATYKWSTVGLMLDGKFISRSTHYNEHGHACSSVSAIVKIEVGAQVWVACTYGSASHVLQVHEIYIMNTFSGVLIGR